MGGNPLSPDVMNREAEAWFIQELGQGLAESIKNHQFIKEVRTDFKNSSNISAMGFTCTDNLV